MTIEVSHQLPNGRWVGGLPAAGGRRVRPRALLRCGELDGVPGPTLDALRRLQPGLVLDLRSDSEIRTPHPLRDHLGYQHQPFVDPERDRERDPSAERTRADLYRGSLRRNGRRVVAAIHTILEARPGPVVVHCKSGVDRTGMLVAIVLAGLGVDRAQIADDYAQLAPPPRWRRTDPPEASTIEEALTDLDRDHGGPAAYLHDHGLGADALARLADRLTTDPNGTPERGQPGLGPV